MSFKRFEDDFSEINKIGQSENGMNRLAYTHEYERALKYLEKECLDAGMKVRIDSCGNFIARREGEDKDLPAVACGSHLDTVYEGGRFDGTVGVLGGLEVIRRLNDHKIKTLHPIELIVFACEESSRFGVSTLGSKVMAGILDYKEIEKLKDRDGISFREAFHRAGLNIENIKTSKRKPEEMKAFVEMHIEQGPHLEMEKLDIGVVTGIAAPTRFRIRITGLASHSGATNMFSRKDALLGASELALAIEEYAKNEKEFGTVGTVGSINIKPNSMNTVPGYAELQVDIRGISIESKENLVRKLKEKIQNIIETRQLNIEYELISHENPALMDGEIQAKLTEYCQSLGFNYKSMQSGAGHDAMNIAKICPTGMIFIPSKDGLSHNKKEFTHMDEIEKGVRLLEEIIKELALPVID